MTTRPSVITPDRRSRASVDTRASDRERDCLTASFGQLDATDAAMLIQVIAKIVEIERTHGEDVALAMLDRAMAYEGEGRRLH